LPTPLVDLRNDGDLLRVVAIAIGIGWAAAFIVIGLAYRLQLYGDGAMFSYSVAVQDVWAFHWHNISGRVAVYFLCLAPAETYVALTGDPAGGIMIYGVLFFVLPLAGLRATYAFDRSPNSTIFTFACASTGLLGPLVFGFPTEMWMAHAVFWPTLALAHYAPPGVGGRLLVLLMLLILVFTHEGAFVLAFVLVATLAARGLRDAAFKRAAGALAVAMAVWAIVKLDFPAGSYFAPVYVRAALGFFDPALLEDPLLRLLLASAIGFGIVRFLLARCGVARADVLASILVATALAVYWLAFDDALHASERYYMRTLLVLLTPLFAIPAVLLALAAGRRLVLAKSLLIWMLSMLRRVPPRPLAFLLLLLSMVHLVETAKFVSVWTQYRAAVRQLATGEASDPALGDPRFVSSQRVPGDLNRLAWFSTTPYLSIILARFAPTRLVIDPTSNYFWLSCETASANADAVRAVPVDTRKLVRTYACEHR
jgi:hypothetical protein